MAIIKHILIYKSPGGCLAQGGRRVLSKGVKVLFSPNLLRPGHCWFGFPQWEETGEKHFLYECLWVSYLVRDTAGRARTAMRSRAKQKLRCVRNHREVIRRELGTCSPHHVISEAFLNTSETRQELPCRQGQILPGKHVFRWSEELQSFQLKWM